MKGIVAEAEGFTPLVVWWDLPHIYPEKLAQIQALAACKLDTEPAAITWHVEEVVVR